MGVVSGNDLAVNGEAQVNQWEVELKGVSEEWTASNLQSGAARCEAVKDFEGIVRGYGHTPQVFPGESFTFTGSIDQSVGISGTARCSYIDIFCPTDQGGNIRYEYGFRRNGAITAGAAVATDTTDPTCYSALERHVDLEDTIANVIFWRLRITSELREYSDSSTSKGILTLAGMIDAVLEYAQHEDTPSNFSTISETVRRARAYVTATTYWELNKMRYEGYRYGASVRGTQNVPSQRSKNVHAIHRWRFDCSQDGSTLGSIKTPAGATAWP